MPLQYNRGKTANLIEPKNKLKQLYYVSPPKRRIASNNSSNRNKYRHNSTLENQPSFHYKNHHSRAHQNRPRKLKTLNHSKNLIQDNNEVNKISRLNDKTTKAESRLIQKSRRYSEANSLNSREKIIYQIQSKAHKNQGNLAMNSKSHNLSKKDLSIKRSPNAYYRQSAQRGSRASIQLKLKSKQIFNSNQELNSQFDFPESSTKNQNQTANYLQKMQRLQIEKNQRIKEIYNPTQKTKSISMLRAKLPIKASMKKNDCQNDNVDNIGINSKPSKDLDNYEDDRNDKKITFDPEQFVKSGRKIEKILTQKSDGFSYPKISQKTKQKMVEMGVPSQETEGKRTSNMPLPKFSKFYDSYTMSLSHENFKSLKSTNINHNSSKMLITTPQTHLIVPQLDQLQKSRQQQQNQALNKSRIPQLQILNELAENSEISIVKQAEGVYYGQIDSQKLKQGKGVYFYHSGSVYQGQYLNNKRHGYGKESFPDGSSYAGAYQNGQRNGKGRFQWANGQIYDGQWINNKKHGSGLWQGLNGCSYLGEWKQGLISGFGVLTTLAQQQDQQTNSSSLYERYEGQFSNFCKQGQGTYRFSNGQKLIGLFHKNQPNGECEYYWTNGDYFKGSFMNGLRHGKGFLKYGNGGEFQGQFRNDKKCGFGREKYHDGIMYIGNFQNDLRHGYGRLEYSQVIYYEGYWLNNKAVIFHSDSQKDNLVQDPNDTFYRNMDFEHMEPIEEDVINERLISRFSNKLSHEKLSKLKAEQKRNLIKAMKSKEKNIKIPVQKFNNQDLLERLYNPKKRACRCAANH